MQSKQSRVIFLLVTALILVGGYFLIFPPDINRELKFSKEFLDSSQRVNVVGAVDSALSSRVNSKMREIIREEIGRDLQGVVKGIKGSSIIGYDVKLRNDLTLVIDKADGENATTSSIALECKFRESPPRSVFLEPGVITQIATSVPVTFAVDAIQSYDCSIQNFDKIVAGNSGNAQYFLSGKLGLILSIEFLSAWRLYLISYVFFGLPLALAILKFFRDVFPEWTSKSVTKP